MQTVGALFLAICLVFGVFWIVAKWPKDPLEIVFPKHDNLGDLWLMESTDCLTCGNGREKLGLAQGSYTIPLPSSGDWYLELRMPRQAANLMHYLDKDPSLRLLESIVLEKSDIQDSDLQFLSKFQLRRINLQATNITGEGLSYLKPHPTWISVDISCNSSLNVEHLEHFSDWKNATISVTGWCGSTQAELSAEAKNQLIKKAGTVICPSGSFNDCAQVR